VETAVIFSRYLLLATGISVALDGGSETWV
jgi:hypothetical protein